MANKKYKEMNIDEKFIHDAVGLKKVRVFGALFFLAIGIWMILTPDGMDHASREKATVWLIKELWSPYLAAILLIGATWALINFISAVKIMSGFTWVKQPGGHYLYKNKEKISGLKCLSNGIDLVVFNPIENEVYTFVDYRKIGLNKYKKVKPNNEFNCNDTYWIADSDGYSILYKGEYVTNMTSEYKGDDLIVSAPDLAKKFRLKNYKANFDNRIRKADRY